MEEATNEKQWYLFNDFSVSHITAEESISFFPDWKLPCLLFYSVRKILINKKNKNLVKTLKSDFSNWIAVDLETGKRSGAGGHTAESDHGRRVQRGQIPSAEIGSITEDFIPSAGGGRDARQGRFSGHGRRVCHVESGRSRTAKWRQIDDRATVADVGRSCYCR